MATRTDRLQVSLEAVGGDKFKAELGGASAATRDVGKAASESTGPIKLAADTSGYLRREVEKTASPLGAMAAAEREAAREADNLAAANRRAATATEASEKSAANWGRTLQQLGVGAAITAILKQTVATIASYDELDARLLRVTRSQQGVTDAMVLSRAAVEGTAISVLDMGDAYAVLRDSGLTPTLATLEALANFAASSGQSIGATAEALGDAAAGNISAFEKLGITATEAGDTIVVTYEDVTSTIENSRTAIVDYLEQIGTQSDAAARDAQTLGGAWADLKNEAAELVDVLSESGLGGTLQQLVQSFADGTSKVADFYAALGRARESGNAAQRQLAGFLVSGPAGLIWEQMKTLTGQGGGTLGATPEDVAAVNARAEAQRLLNDELAMGAANLATLGAEDAKANAEGQVALQRMTEQLAVFGQTRAEAIEYTATQVAAKTADKDLATQILATGRALADKARLMDASKKSTSEQTAASRELREELREGEKAYKQYMRELVANEQAMIDGWDATDDLREAVEKLESSFDPAAEAMRKMIAAEELLDKAYKAGVITLEQYDAMLEKIYAREQEIGRGNRVATVWSSFTGQSEAESERSIVELGNSFSRVFGDAMLNGFDDIDERLGDALKATLSDAFAESFQRNVIDNLVNAANGGELDGQALAGGVGQAGGAYLGGQAGGGGEGAQSGAMAGVQVGAAIGSIFGPIGTIVGAVLGGIIGGLIGGMGDDPPEIDARGPGAANANAQEGYAVGPYGRVGVTTTESDVDSTELAQAIVSLDAAISQLLTADENRRVRDALTNFSVNNASDPATVLAARLNAIIQEVEPGWMAFLERYTDVQEKAEAFAALKGIENSLLNIDAISHQLSGTTLEMLRDQLNGLDDDLTQAMDAFRTAWESGVAVDIDATSVAAMQALVDRYNAEIQMVNEVKAAIDQAAAEAYQLNLAIAQRIAASGGDLGGPSAVTGARVEDLRAAIAAAQSAQQALALLNQFVSAVDAWVSARTTQINAELNAGLAEINAQRSAIQAQQAWQAQAQAMLNEARQRELRALQEQLRLANEWLSILQRADAQQQAMQFGQENPLGGFGRLDAINQAIAALTSGDISGLSAARAGELLDLLQQRLQLIMSEGLFDRPSDEYLDQYNDTLAMIDIVRGLAEAGSADAEDLQARIAELQAQLVDTNSAGFSSTNSALARLQEQEEILRAQAQAQLDELNAQALAQYEFARDEAEANQDARTLELREQLELLTGGLDVQEFIALRQQEAVELLAEIESGLREFLNYVSGQQTTTAGGSQSGTAPATPPGSPGNSTGIEAGGVVMHVTINATSLDSNQVVEALRNELPRMASVIKRELQVA